MEKFTNNIGENGTERERERESPSTGSGRERVKNREL